MKLKKGLGLIHIFCIAFGAMISSGLFVLPGLAHAEAGPAVIVSYFLAGILATVGALSVAELATAMPKAGGDYFFISRGMGPGVGTVSGLLSWFSLSLKSAFALVGLMAFASLILPMPDVGKYFVERGMGIVLCGIFVGFNLLGVKGAARVQVILVCGLLGLMVFYVFRGLPEVNMQHFEPFAPKGMRAVFGTAGLVFVSYGGLLKIASVAEESKNPRRVIPLGIVLALLTATVFYAAMVFVTSGVLSADQLDGSLTPISDGAAAFMGRGGVIALSVAAILAFLTTANAGIMAASRYLLALSRDNMLPDSLGRVSKRFKTPYAAVLVTGALVAVALFVNLKVLVEAASTVFMLSFILSNVAVIVLRESGLQNYRPSFRAPLYPWLQIFGITALVFVILEMGEEAFVIVAVLVIAGICVYWFYGRKRTQRESALVLLIQRIADKWLVTGSLESELKEILRERDEIVQDRFDRIIETSSVLDLDKPTSAEEFFRLVADKLAERLNMSAQTLLELLIAREADGGTVVSPRLAVPHIVIEGEHTFDILLVRSRPGIAFPDASSVHSAFVLVGTKDERNFHLRALSAIAQVVQNPGFEEKWLAAHGEQALRDIVVLGERRRAGNGNRNTRR